MLLVHLNQTWGSSTPQGKWSKNKSLLQNWIILMMMVMMMMNIASDVDSPLPYKFAKILLPKVALSLSRTLPPLCPSILAVRFWSGGGIVPVANPAHALPQCPGSVVAPHRHSLVAAAAIYAGIWSRDVPGFCRFLPLLKRWAAPGSGAHRMAVRPCFSCLTEDPWGPPASLATCTVFGK